MIERRKDIEALGASVILVAYDEPVLLEAKILHELELPYPLLLDRARETYASWGMGRTGLRGAMLSPSRNRHRRGAIGQFLPVTFTFTFTLTVR